LLLTCPCSSGTFDRERRRSVPLEGNQCRIISGFMHSAAKSTLPGLQCFDVLFVALHNWIPLAKLNDVSGVRKEFPGSKLLITTLINFTPYAFGLAASAVYFERTFPGWLFWRLWISYGVAVYGSLKAWWIPYPFHPDPILAERYRVMHAATHTFLVNGMASARILCT
jgi:hypothetical protein